MSDFYRDFLHHEITDTGRHTPPVVHLAAFGKHPAWNDHMEDIGLVTQTLLETKRILYLQGIATQIDTNAWEKLPPESVTPAYDHWFLWHRPGEALVGRLLPSRDGKNRTRYPLVLVAHIINVPLVSALALVAAPLDRAAAEIQKATTPEKVRDTLQRTQAALTISFKSAFDAPPAVPAFPAPASASPFDATGWARILHSVSEQLRVFAPGAPTPRETFGRHLRLPALASVAHPTEHLLWWTAFWLTQLDHRIPALHIYRVGVNTVDTVLGLPLPAHFYSLRAVRDVLPALSDVPYKTDEAVNRYAAALAASPGQFPVASYFSPQESSENVLPLLTHLDALRSELRGGGLLGGLLKIFGK